QRSLAEARRDCADSATLVQRAAAAFELDVDDLTRVAEAWRHVNSTHAGGGAPQLEGAVPRSDAGPVPEDEASVAFAADVLVHVGLHEMAHALVREFDLPVLANEEALADAFATWYLVEHMPDRAPAVLGARVASLMYEAHEIPRAEWPVAGEHPSDARRAFQIAALAYAADRERYAPLADQVGMVERDRRSAADYGTEILRSWRRTTDRLWMPDGRPTREFAHRDRADVLQPVRAAWVHASAELVPALQRVDWHSQVKLRLESGGDGAGWSRSKRTITVEAGYVERFLRQGAAIAAERSGEHAAAR
ncbi:MAG: DUF4344 domain-containing metallopeptidase, partial [Planctomycetota bacterium]